MMHSWRPSCQRSYIAPFLTGRPQITNEVVMRADQRSTPPPSFPKSTQKTMQQFRLKSFFFSTTSFEIVIISETDANLRNIDSFIIIFSSCLVRKAFSLLYIYIFSSFWQTLLFSLSYKDVLLN